MLEAADICAGAARLTWRDRRGMSLGTRNIFVFYFFLFYTCTNYQIKQLQNAPLLSRKFRQSEPRARFPYEGWIKTTVKDVSSQQNNRFVVELKQNTQSCIKCSATVLPTLLSGKCTCDFFQLFTKLFRIDLKFVYLIIRLYKLYMICE